MRVFTILTLFLGFFFLGGQGTEAQTSENNATCYPLNSEQAANILARSQIPLYDGDVKWVIDYAGQGFLCLDYCSKGGFEVGVGVFKDEKCTYTITNGAEADMVGRTTEIVLKRVPSDRPSKGTCLNRRCCSQLNIKEMNVTILQNLENQERKL